MLVAIQKCGKSFGRWQPERVEDSTESDPNSQAKQYLRKRCVQGGKRGGDPKDKDDGECGMARKEEDEILHGRS